MKPTRRRSFLQIILASIGSTVAGSRRASGQSHAQTTASLDASPRAKAIRALRVVNSLQNWHFNDRGQFIPLEELMRDDLAQRFVANMRMPPFTPANVARTGQLLEGFVTSFQLAPDRTSYVIFLREKSSTKTFTTDSRGVIKEGAIDVPLDRFANVPSTSLTAAFRGAPIVPPERPRAKRPTILGIVGLVFCADSQRTTRFIVLRRLWRPLYFCEGMQPVFSKCLLQPWLQHMHLLLHSRSNSM